MKILVLANFGMGLYNFRRELLKELIEQNHEVYISLPNDEYVPKLEELGCKFIDTHLDRRGTNPFTDFRLTLQYVKMLRHIKPDLVLTYTIKPNVYGGIACAITKTPYITNITGLGTSVENKGFIQKVTLTLYRLGLEKSSCVFFQNESNRTFFTDNKIVKSNSRLIPGSGVNLDQHKYEEYPIRDEQLRFLFIGRIMKAKGIEELLEAAVIIKKEYPNVQFDLVGGIEEIYNDKLEELDSLDIINYHGKQEEVHAFIKKSHAIILPSYHEGLANVLLESASSGRPVLASKVPGCIETFDEGLTGFGFEARSVEGLVKAIIKFINLPYNQKIAMGLAGRRKMEIKFDRNLVINAYLQEIKKVMDKENNNEFIRDVG
ncbi:glycosyltransferase family 4 protein [Oceanobacillus chungangensis]|uniref:Glycosyltransferase family 1 protein n=1 Tax=Oceanobacillus chungangensis TaxID=1229152 RepID=A0A3D8Q003_9BACI|nr:glycosyltransferase family 4 protein [Oceanobacillus chungangensis]RDW20749.1 glycosyltransferase family 1 protein [Oceanobacillus chungangensis]